MLRTFKKYRKNRKEVVEFCAWFRLEYHVYRVHVGQRKANNTVNYCHAKEGKHQLRHVHVCVIVSTADIVYLG